jgi:hypothetical protein
MRQQSQELWVKSMRVDMVKPTYRYRSASGSKSDQRGDIFDF